jgi:protein-S-isoprenylcysteine O-methyltransferase Ste14
MGNQYLSNKPRVHRLPEIRLYSYILYLFFFLIGVSFNIIFNYKIFNPYSATLLGFVFLILATLLIIWIQPALQSRQKADFSKENFYLGPYRYTRSPTHFGLFLLMLGFGLIANSFFITLFAIISFIIGKFIFSNREEKFLIKKYGTPYLEYKKLVRF